MNTINKLIEKRYFKFQIVFLFLFIWFTYLFNKTLYLPIHDYLEVTFTLKEIKSLNYNIFDLSYEFNNFLGSYRYNLIPYSEFHYLTLTEYIFGTLNSEIFHNIFLRLSNLFFSYNIFKRLAKNKTIALTASSYFSLTDIWPFALPNLFVTLLLFNYFLDKNNKFLNFLLIISPFYFDLIYGGIFITLIFLILLLKNNQNNLGKIIFVSITHVVLLFFSNYRLLYELLFLRSVTKVNDSSQPINVENIKLSFDYFIKANLEGQYHFVGAPRYLLGVLFFLYFIFLCLKKFRNELTNNQNQFLKFYFFIQLINFVYAIELAKFISFNFIFGLDLNLHRVIIFNQLLWCIGLIYFLNNLNLKTINFTLFIFVLFLNSSFVTKIKTPDTFSDINNQYIRNQLILAGQRVNFIDYILYTSYGYLFQHPQFTTIVSFYETPENYFLEDEFNELKKNLTGKEVFASIDMNPMIAGFNGLKIADGYFILHDTAYKDRFRKVIIDELKSNQRSQEYFENWGLRLNLFFPTKNSTFNLNNINFCELKNISVTHLLSKNEYYSDNLSLFLETKQLKVYEIINLEDCF